MSLKEKLISAGVVTAQDADKRILESNKKEENKKYSELRLEKKKLLSNFPINRLGTTVRYAKWLAENKSINLTCCGLCGEKVSVENELSGTVSNKDFVIGTTTETEFIDLIAKNNLWSMKELSSFVNIPKDHYISYKVDKHDVTINACHVCIMYYLSNKYYPNHRKKSYVSTKDKQQNS